MILYALKLILSTVVGANNFVKIANNVGGAILQQDALQTLRRSDQVFIKLCIVGATHRRVGNSARHVPEEIVLRQNMTWWRRSNNDNVGTCRSIVVAPTGHIRWVDLAKKLT